MSNIYKIEIVGLSDLNEFVKKWSSVYSYRNEDKYKNHIDKALEDEVSFNELFKWKNGTGDVISEKKLNGVSEYWVKVNTLKCLREKFDWVSFENEFNPHKSSTIWKLFLLHLMNPSQYPMFDQHVYRSYLFFKEGVIHEIPNSSKEQYLIYKNGYIDWFNKLKVDFNESPKKMDESFFSFGKMLKGLIGKPIQIIK